MLCNVALDSPTTSRNLEILMLSFTQAAYFNNKLARLMVRGGLTPFDTIALSFFLLFECEGYVVFSIRHS